MPVSVEQAFHVMDIFSAIADDDKAAVLAMIKAGVDINARTESSHSSPLHRAAMYDSPEIVSLLLDKGADINALDGSGCTALHIAAMDLAATSIGDTVEVLISRGADVNAQDHDGQTALYLAASESNHIGVDLLLAAGADPTIADHQGRKPSDVAGQTWHVHDKAEEMKQALLTAEKRTTLQQISARARSKEDLATPEQALATRQAKYGRAM